MEILEGLDKKSWNDFLKSISNRNSKMRSWKDINLNLGKDFKLFLKPFWTRILEENPEPALETEILKRIPKKEILRTGFRRQTSWTKYRRRKSWIGFRNRNPETEQNSEMEITISNSEPEILRIGFKNQNHNIFKAEILQIGFLIKILRIRFRKKNPERLILKQKSWL